MSALRLFDPPAAPWCKFKLNQGVKQTGIFRNRSGPALGQETNGRGSSEATMKLAHLPEGTTDWSTMPVALIPGASGSAQDRVHRVGDVQLRVVESVAGYLADHWCSKGHVLYVIAGKLAVEHQNTQPDRTLSAGMSWYVPDDDGTPHRVRSDSGGTISILD